MPTSGSEGGGKSHKTLLDSVPMSDKFQFDDLKIFSSAQLGCHCARKEESYDVETPFCHHRESFGIEVLLYKVYN